MNKKNILMFVVFGIALIGFSSITIRNLGRDNNVQQSRYSDSVAYDHLHYAVILQEGVDGEITLLIQDVFDHDFIPPKYIEIIFVGIGEKIKEHGFDVLSNFQATLYRNFDKHFAIVDCELYMVLKLLWEDGSTQLFIQQHEQIAIESRAQEYSVSFIGTMSEVHQFILSNSKN